MSKLIRIGLSTDPNHSISDFPVNVYTGTTSGDTSNWGFTEEPVLSFPEVITSPLEFYVDDELLSFGIRLQSDGCHEQDIFIESPRVDCDLCVSFMEHVPPQPTATPNPTPNPTTTILPTNAPTSTPNATPQPTPEKTANPTATPQGTPFPTPNPTNEPTPNPTNEPTPNPTNDPTSTPGLQSCRFVFVPNSINTSGYGLDYVQGGNIVITPFSNLTSTPTTYDGVVGEVYGVCSESHPLYYDFNAQGGGTAITDPSGVERPPNGGICSINKNCVYSPPQTETYYRIQDCINGFDFHAPQGMQCQGGNFIIPINTYSVGDVVQFIYASAGCGSATYCGTIIDTNFQAAVDSETAYISREAPVGGCNDFLHCQQ